MCYWTYLCKAYVSNLVTYLDQTFLLECGVVLCGSKNGYKIVVFKKYQIARSKYDIYFRFNSQSNGRTYTID